jgi:hypothetical protein
MSKYELTKSIEARKLNPRTGIPTSDPLVTIPFGAIIQDVTQDRDDRKFSYLGLRYQCTDEVFRVATVAVDSPSGAAGPQASQPKLEAPAPADPAAAEPASAAPAPEQPAVFWERLSSNGRDLMRVRVPGGWLVALADSNASPGFYPDPRHQWR